MEAARLYALLLSYCSVLHIDASMMVNEHLLERWKSNMLYGGVLEVWFDIAERILPFRRRLLDHLLVSLLFEFANEATKCVWREMPQQNVDFKHRDVEATSDARSDQMGNCDVP
jgi:hypothetical protein